MLHRFQAFNLATELYWRCKDLPLPHHLKDQIHRASSSVATNLAEGSGKPTPKDQRRYYAMSFGSLREVQSILILEKIEDRTITRICDHLGAMLYKLCRGQAAQRSPQDRAETPVRPSNINPSIDKHPAETEQYCLGLPNGY